MLAKQAYQVIDIKSSKKYLINGPREYQQIPG